MKYFIYNFKFIPQRLLTTHKWPAPNVSDVIAWLVRASHRCCGSRLQTPFKSWLFAGFYICNWINCFHNCEDHSFIHFTSAVQYLKYFTYSFTFIPHRLLGTNTWQAPNVSVFIPQLVRASHRCRGVTGSNPIKVPTFCRLLYTQLNKLLLQLRGS